MLAAPAADVCRHCGGPGAPFCCPGCETVFALLHAEGLTRYYDLRDAADARPVATGAPADHKWLEPLLDRRGREQLRLDVQGIHCSACVWLIEELFRRLAGAGRVVVNPALGTLVADVAPEFPLAGFVDSVERFGYRLGPPDAGRGALEDDTLPRLGFSAAVAMNGMIFAIAGYAGLDIGHGPLGRFVAALQFGLAGLAVVVGGAPFYRSALEALRRRTLHLDLPIALGMTLAFAGSTAAWLGGHPERAYFDTVAVFITLMLLGRFLQQRILERNRRALLAADDVDGLLARVVEDGRAAIVPCRQIGAGARLLVAPGDLVCVDAVSEKHTLCSLDWVNGEPAPRAFAPGEPIPAGAANAGDQAFTATALGGFDASAVRALLRTTQTRHDELPRATAFWQRIARAWVWLVLGTATTVFAGWILAGAGVARALDVVTAILVVTCPCAFGIATPLGYELVQAGLRRAGLYVRTAGFLDRALAVRRVAFDKTGTLTTGRLRLADPAPLADLSDDERAALYDLAARSSHPASAAVRRALEPGPTLSPDAQVVEEPGRGLELTRDGRRFRLGQPAWAIHELAPADELAFSVDGVARARLRLVEDLRPDAAAEVAQLAAAGLEVSILSGDASARVARIAATLGIPAERAHGALSPADKRAWLEVHDRGDTLAIGDGLNDAPLVEAAFCSGTPAVDRPFLPARSDFYFVTPGLRPVRLALVAARRLRAVNRRNLAMAVAYNLATVGLAAAGLMSPLLCAVVMPLSSLTVVLSTTLSLSQRSALWRS